MRKTIKPNQKTIEHPEVGLVLFKKNPRSKRITLKVKTDGQVVVTLPQSVAYRSAEPILHQNIAWVKQQLEKARRTQKAKLLTEGSCFQIRNKSLSIQVTEESELRVRRNVTQMDILVPQIWAFESSFVQESLKNLITELLRVEAKSYLPQRTKILASQKGILINNVRVKKVKTRWGSCSSKSNINLSLYLMLLSDDLIDYVILHELAHIKHQNHSTAFWTHLENLLPGAKQLDKQLNQYRIPFL